MNSLNKRIKIGFQLGSSCVLQHQEARCWEDRYLTWCVPVCPWGLTRCINTSSFRVRLLRLQLEGLFSSAGEAALQHLHGKAHLRWWCQGCVSVQSAQHGQRRCRCGLWPFSGWNGGTDPAKQRWDSCVCAARWSILHAGLCSLHLYCSSTLCSRWAGEYSESRRRDYCPVAVLSVELKKPTNTWDKQMQ